MARKRRTSIPATTIRLTPAAELAVQQYESEQGRSRTQAVNELIEIGSRAESNDSTALAQWRKFLKARKERVTAAAKMMAKVKEMTKAELEARRPLKQQPADVVTAQELDALRRCEEGGAH